MQRRLPLKTLEVVSTTVRLAIAHEIQIAVLENCLDIMRQRTDGRAPTEDIPDTQEQRETIRALERSSEIGNAIFLFAFFFVGGTIVVLSLYLFYELEEFSLYSLTHPRPAWLTVALLVVHGIDVIVVTRSFVNVFLHTKGRKVSSRRRATGVCKAGTPVVDGTVSPVVPSAKPWVIELLYTAPHFLFWSLASAVHLQLGGDAHHDGTLLSMLYLVVVPCWVPAFCMCCHVAVDSILSVADGLVALHGTIFEHEKI